MRATHICMSKCTKKLGFTTFTMFCFTISQFLFDRLTIASSSLLFCSEHCEEISQILFFLFLFESFPNK